MTADTLKVLVNINHLSQQIVLKLHHGCLLSVAHSPKRPRRHVIASLLVRCRDKAAVGLCPSAGLGDALFDSWLERSSYLTSATVPPTEITLPILPICMRLVPCSSRPCCHSEPTAVFRFLAFPLPSLLPELASGTLVSGLLIPDRIKCGLIVAELAAVISPSGGKCEAYSSARLRRLLAHISAMPLIACWNSGQSADRRMLAKAYDETGGKGWTAAGRALDTVD